MRDLTLYPKHLRPILDVLIKHEDQLSDGFSYYLPYGDDADPHAVLEAIAQELYEAASLPAEAQG